MHFTFSRKRSSGYGKCNRNEDRRQIAWLNHNKILLITLLRSQIPKGVWLFYVLLHQKIRCFKIGFQLAECPLISGKSFP